MPITGCVLLERNPVYIECGDVDAFTIVEINDPWIDLATAEYKLHVAIFLV